MRLPKYDVLLPVLFVGVIYPTLAGGWWRFLSGHADQVMGSPMHSRTAPATIASPSPAVARPSRRPVKAQTSRGRAALEEPRPALLPEEPSQDKALFNDDSYDEGAL